MILSTMSNNPDIRKLSARWAIVAFVLHGVTVVVSSFVLIITSNESVQRSADTFVHRMDRPIQWLDEWFQDALAYHLGPVEYPQWWPLSPFLSAVVIDGLIHVLIGGLAYAVTVAAVAWVWNRRRSR